MKGDKVIPKVKCVEVADIIFKDVTEIMAFDGV
jgi:hypothetical protein